MKTKLLCILLLVGSLTAISQININYSGPKLGLKKKDKDKKEEKENTATKEESKQAEPVKQETQQPVTQSTPTQAPVPVKKTYTEAEKTKLLDKNNFPGYKADKAYLEKTAEIYKPNSGQLQWLNSPAINAMKPTLDTLDRIAKTYGDMWAVYEMDAGKEEITEQLHDDIGHYIKRYLEDYKYHEFNRERVNPSKANYTEAAELAQKKLDTFTPEKYKDDMPYYDNTYRWGDVEELLEKGDRHLAFLKLEKGENDEKVQEVMKKRESTMAKINPLQKTFMDKVHELEMKHLESQRLPADKYTGADKEALRKKIFAVNSSCKTTKLLKVIMTDPKWERSKGTEWDSRNQTYHDYDNSLLMVAIVLYSDKTPDVAYVVDGLTLSKNNYDNTIDYNIPTYFTCPEIDPSRIDKVQKVLMKYVK